MAIQMTDVQILCGGVDLTGHSNSVTLEAAVEDLDSTTFDNAGWRTFEPGLIEVTSTVEGFFDASAVDSALFTQFGTTDIPYTVIADGVSYTTKVMRPVYQFGGAVGQLLPYTSTVKGYGQPLVRSSSLQSSASAVTSTGTGAATEIGAVSSTQSLYASLHVLSVSGTTPSLTVKVQSDVDGTFATPADQITFTAATATGAQYLTAAGAITDTFYRVSYTVSGTSPSFAFAVVTGIAAT